MSFLVIFTSALPSPEISSKISIMSLLSLSSLLSLLSSCSLMILSARSSNWLISSFSFFPYPNRSSFPSGPSSSPRLNLGARSRIPFTSLRISLLSSALDEHRVLMAIRQMTLLVMIMSSSPRSTAARLDEDSTRTPTSLIISSRRMSTNLLICGAERSSVMQSFFMNRHIISKKLPALTNSDPS
ncbi:hypothetical protein RHGRI_010457 [Rhododendron griersonianum]|uniref:Secreted protein n=1 Tax=Rhododendron griersonianum TaxID=479676 RepID=A0AAV6KJ01_9ERIC|nr:hypothetical protein RHGRI_010457 [Rhododendron griersonianum]